VDLNRPSLCPEGRCTENFSTDYNRKYPTKTEYETFSSPCRPVRFCPRFSRSASAGCPLAGATGAGGKI